jgi:hypothetical protein
MNVTSKDLEIEEVHSQEIVKEQDSHLMEEFSTVKQYNDNITDYHPSIKSYVPMRNILIRIYRRLPVMTNDGLMFNTPDIGDYAKIQKVAGSGQKYALPEQLAKFNFTQKAVIVKLPLTYQGSLKEGQVVNIEQLLITGDKIGQTVYQEYMYQFIHPDANSTLPTSDCTNPFYGYALIPDTIIKGYNV